MKPHAAILIILLLPTSFAANACEPPPGFIDTAAPDVSQPNDFVSHTESIEIGRALPVVMSAASRPLKDQIKKSEGLPGVVGSYSLTPDQFGAVGTRRLNCLSDGSTLVEQVLPSAVNNFRYVVWNYTSEKARAVQFGVGHFVYTPVASNRTKITWTYSFKLDETHFPGRLGGLGRWLFRTFFLDRDYASMMKGVLESTKEQALREEASS